MLARRRRIASGKVCMADQTDVRPVGARTRRRRHVRRQTRRSLIHTALAIIPGAGLLGTRYRRLGWIMLTSSRRSCRRVAVRPRQGRGLGRPQRRRPTRRPARRSRASPSSGLWSGSSRSSSPTAAPRPTASTAATRGVCASSRPSCACSSRSRRSRWSATRSSSATSSAPSSPGRPSAASPRRPSRPRPPRRRRQDPWADVDRVNLLLLGSTPATTARARVPTPWSR